MATTTTTISIAKTQDNKYRVEITRGDTSGKDVISIGPFETAGQARGAVVELTQALLSKGGEA